VHPFITSDLGKGLMNELLTKKELCERLRISQSTFYRSLLPKILEAQLRSKGRKNYFVHKGNGQGKPHRLFNLESVMELWKSLSS